MTCPHTLRHEVPDGAFVCSQCGDRWYGQIRKATPASGPLESDDAPRLDPKITARIEHLNKLAASLATLVHAQHRRLLALESATHEHKTTILTGGNGDSIAHVGPPVAPDPQPEPDMTSADIVAWVTAVGGSFADPNDKPVDYVGGRCPTCRNPPGVLGNPCNDMWHLSPEASFILPIDEASSRAADALLTKKWQEIKANPEPAMLHTQAQTIKRLQEEIAERDASDELRQKAQQRAIERWRADTCKHMTIPDHADLCVWLFERVERGQENYAKLLLVLRDAQRARDLAEKQRLESVKP